MHAQGGTPAPLQGGAPVCAAARGGRRQRARSARPRRGAARTRGRAAPRMHAAARKGATGRAQLWIRGCGSGAVEGSASSSVTSVTCASHGLSRRARSSPDSPTTAFGCSRREARRRASQPARCSCTYLQGARAWSGAQTSERASDAAMGHCALRVLFERLASLRRLYHGWTPSAT